MHWLAKSCITIGVTFVNPVDIHLIEKRRKTATVALRMEPGLKEVAEKAAADDRRTLTQFFEKLLTDYLKAKGYLK